MIDPVISRKKVAQILSVSMATFERLERAGVLPRRIQVSQRRFGYLESDIAKYLTCCGQKPVKPMASGWEAPGKSKPDDLGWFLTFRDSNK